MAKGDPSIKPFSQWDTVDEDAAANSCGGGGIPGIGIGDAKWAEPGVDLRKKRKGIDPLAEGADALEHARDEAIDNELLTVSEMGKYRKETPENKHGIAQVRAFRRAGSYADMYHVDMDALKERICGAPKGSANWKYFEKECGKKLYEEVNPDDTFAGAAVFNTGMDEVMKSRNGKLRYHRWSRYVGESEKGEAIREYGKSNRKQDIVLKDEQTGVMTYLRRKK